MICYYTSKAFRAAVVITVTVFIRTPGRGSTVGDSAPHQTSEQIKRWTIATPKPEYPVQARAHHVTGEGMFMMRVQRKSGRVKNVEIIHATGSKMLDDAAIQGLYRWRFKPGVLPSIRYYHPKTKDPFAEEDLLLSVPIGFVRP